MFLNLGIRNYISNRNCHNWYFFNFYTSTTDNGHFKWSHRIFVTLFFIAMKAPDLALTQLVVETITTILFIVSFSRLPNVPRSNANKKREIIKISVSLLMALIVVSLIFITQQTDGLSSISDFYLKADKLTGGKNIVNAILGDFRALDTLFEGLVLIITGLGIYTLLNYQDRRGQDERE